MRKQLHVIRLPATRDFLSLLHLDEALHRDPLRRNFLALYASPMGRSWGGSKAEDISLRELARPRGMVGMAERKDGRGCVEERKNGEVEDVSLRGLTRSRGVVEREDGRGSLEERKDDEAEDVPPRGLTRSRRMVGMAEREDGRGNVEELKGKDGEAEDISPRGLTGREDAVGRALREESSEKARTRVEEREWMGSQGVEEVRAMGDRVEHGLAAGRFRDERKSDETRLLRGWGQGELYEDKSYAANMTDVHSQDDASRFATQNPALPNDIYDVVMGISGKTEEMLSTLGLQDERVRVLRRFTGGGTVVFHRDDAFVMTLALNANEFGFKPYPREAMGWTAEMVYGPAFERASKVTGSQNIKLSSSSLPLIESAPITKVKYALTGRENDYVINHKFKVGGNAQAISGERVLHHTSFLWRVNPQSMKYLAEPLKRPNYRGERNHVEFLQGLEDYLTSKDDFFNEAIVRVQTLLGPDTEIVNIESLEQLPVLATEPRSFVVPRGLGQDQFRTAC